MDEKVYGYMDWPRIEAIVYGEETAPRDVMGPRITQDGVLIQGFFPDAEEVSVISGKKTTLFPYTTLFRLSEERRVGKECISFLFRILDRFSAVIPSLFLVIKILSLRSYSSKSSG